MAYQILLVDDELPALRLLTDIIQKYAPDFAVAAAVTSGERAYDYLREHAADAMITDISMKKMNGIELAKLARELQPDIHIMILSGYGEFEYAQGAIQAAVDDYILKPVGINQLRQRLDKLKAALDEERASHAAAILPALACDLPYSKEDVARHYARQSYRFALVRWGGVNPRYPRSLRATSLILPAAGNCFALRGRDDDEQVLIFPDDGLERFLANISVRMAQRAGVSTWTVVYQPAPQPAVGLSSFLKQALPMLNERSVLGRHQILPLEPGARATQALPPELPDQLNYFDACARTVNVKDFFLSLAATLEAAACPQQQVWDILQRLVLSLAGCHPSIKADCERILGGIADLFAYACSYGELFASAYGVLFEEEGAPRDRKRSARELYDFAMRCIDEQYAKPLSVQSVCDELGISQTYLSRLFRKYSDTTFNNSLMRRRMEAAKALLRENPSILLRDVAACVGYGDSSYFSKVFHQYTGQTPSQYATGR